MKSALATIAVALLATTPAAAQSPDAEGLRVGMQKYCVTCHNERTRAGALVLAALDPGHPTSAAPVWEKVIRKLRSGAMPPVGMPRPDRDTYDRWVAWFEGELDRAAQATPNPGSKPIHRLNRVEYANAIRELLDVEVDARALLPADDLSYGFDNIADVLSVSPGLMERYMSAARRISAMAVAQPATRPMISVYRTSDVLLQNDRMSEDQPIGSRGGLAVRHYFPVSGEYVLRMRLQRRNQDAVGANVRNQLDVRVDHARAGLLTIGGERSRGTGLYTIGDSTPDPEVRVAVNAGTRLVGASFFEKQTWVPEGAAPRHFPVRSFSYSAREMAVDAIEIEGPFNGAPVQDTPSRRRIFSCTPTRTQDERACATQILTALARRAYRRPVVSADVDSLLRLYDIGRRTGSFDAGIEWAIEKMLCSVDFLFRIETEPAAAAVNSVYRLDDVALASRLSFFLWSGPPDEELLTQASRGQLRDDRVLDRQVRRMLADRRAGALVQNFATQWLHLRDVGDLSKYPDSTEFPDFDDNLREAAQRETQLFLESQIREDVPVGDLLTADYTFVNERLARHYGIRHVYGSHFRRVSLAGTRRGGLLGHASILTLTSYPTRTSPVKRGQWILENIIGAPPPPPPPNVPALPENDDAGVVPASVRARMEKHRANPVCASCHAVMDPLGFALENYDGTGRWRDRDVDGPINASSVLLDGTKFAGPSELRTLLRSRSDQFAATVTEKLMTYALGRGLEYYDMPAVRQVVRSAASTDYRWSALVLGIVRSVPFQMKRVAAEPHGR